MLAGGMSAKNSVCDLYGGADGQRSPQGCRAATTTNAVWLGSGPDLDLIAVAPAQCSPPPMAAAQTQRATVPEHLAAAVAAVAAAVLMTWPLARKAGDHILAAIYHWDAYTNMMIMGSRVDAVLGRGPLSLYDNYFHAPLPHSIAFNENHFGLSLIFAPLYLITDNPLWAYNLTLLTSMALSVFFTYLLVRRLTGNGHVGILAGVAFAFSPYVMFELGRIQLVATQWIPACFLMLHRAIEERRLRDVAGFWLCYLLQLGTCLYYAMFLIPLLGLVAAVLLFRQRPPRKVYLEFAAVGAVAGVIALAMVYPYFTMRETFALERSVSFASSYDGKLDFFSNVHETNLTLTGMHHHSEQRGAHEEIAFPGFTVLAMLLLSLGLPLWRALRGLGPRAIGALAGRWAVIAALTIAATLLTRSMLAGAAVLGLSVWQETRRGAPLPFSGQRGLCLVVLVLSIVMFLGLAPVHWEGAPVRGLYYYFHSYVPGFDGIRKVSRQAVMTTFAFCLLASFGSAWLFSKLSRPWARTLLLSTLLATTCYELRCFPHPVRSVWTGATLPQAYRFLASLPPQDLVTFTPQNDGVTRFWGDRGMALYNYLALYHKHRFLNGQGSHMPPVTDLVRRATHHLPDEGARRVLQILEARNILVHAEDLPPARRNLPALLAAQPEQYRCIFQQGTHSVFSLSAPDDPTLALVAMPTLPADAQPIPHKQLRANADLESEHVGRAIDGNPRTFWTGRRRQARGQYFELELARPRPVVAFEIETRQHVMQVPLSYELSAAHGGSNWHTLAEQPVLRLFREQVYSPKTFVFRIVLPKPTLADRIRITIGQPVPGHNFTIHEAHVYAREP
jgi:hypothetical protein